MAEVLNTRDQGCELSPFERNRYFYGKLLSTRDFETEQRYMIGKDRLINSYVHGAGIVCGLELTNPDVNNEMLFVDLTAGLGLDCCGREIIVSNSINNLRVRGNLQEGTNYLYLHYHECVKEPVPALANASTCEEVCCYNRVQESYEVRVSADPPVMTDAQIEGVVNQQLINNATGPLPGARVEALRDGVVYASTLTSDNGGYTLDVLADTYVIRASATGFQSASTSGTSVASGGSISIEAFVLEPAADTPDASMRCHEMTQQYYEERLRFCPQCDDPKVFLAVVELSPQGQISLDAAATRRHREVVYNNPMLHALLCDHVSDFHNPHHTTAADVLALQSVNNVGNTPGQPHVSNIDLVSSNSTIQITPQPDSQQIDIATSPANNVTSIGPAPVVGNALNFAREDHVHDLGPDAVFRSHLNPEDVIGSLLTSEGTITITPSLDNRTINVDTNPANSVTSVGPTPVVGNSLNFAREDHVHDLQADGVQREHLNGEDVIGGLLTSSNNTVQITPDVNNKTIDLRVQAEVSAGVSFINKVGPDTSGNVYLTAGSNISIQENNSTNEVVISATGGGGAAIDIPSGRVIFEQMTGQGQTRYSPPISHELPTDDVAIVTALSSGEVMLSMGDMAHLSPEAPLFWSLLIRPGEFVISLQDRRAEGQEPPPPLDFVVRWWAIPKTLDREDVIAPSTPLISREALDDLVVSLVGMQPGITNIELGSLLPFESRGAFFSGQLENLISEGRILRNFDGQDSRLYLTS